MPTHTSTPHGRQLLQALDAVDRWRADARATIARYHRQGQPVPPDEIRRLIASIPKTTPENPQ